MISFGSARRGPAAHRTRAGNVMGGRAARRQLLLLGGGWSESGGIANRTRLFAREFARRGWEVRVIGRAGTERRFQLHRESGMVVLDVPGFGRPAVGGLLYLAVVVPSMMTWAARSTLVFCLQLSSPLTAASLGALLTRVPVVASTTSTGEFSEVTYLESSRTAPLRRWFARRATLLLGQTEAAASELRRLVAANRVHVLPTPVEIPREVHPLPGRGLVVYVGRLSSEKHLPELLAAWREVISVCPSARLQFVGSGGAYRSIEEDLRKAVSADTQLRQTVTFAGHVTDVRRLLREADIFVQPSRTEGMSNALLEACSEGRAVIATRIPGNTAVLGVEYPLYVPPGDVAALAEALLLVLTDHKVAAEAARQAREAGCAHAVDVVVDRLISLLHRGPERVAL